MNEIIEIALAADDGYFHGLLVTACSIAEFAAKDVRLNFNILDGGITVENWDLLSGKILELHHCSSFNRIIVNEKLFEKYPAWNGNRMAYARLILPEALKEKKWVIYCDADFLWMRDIGELWNERAEQIALIGTKDGVQRTMISEARWFRERGYPFNPEKYFCSGLCFMNLDLFRSYDLINKCLDFLHKHPDVHYPDQNALNVITWGMTKIIPQTKWQVFTQNLTQDELDAGTVIHFAGEIPWKKIKNCYGLQLLSDTMLIWHRYNAHIRGISIWRSLRTYFSPWWIVFHRAPVFLLRCPLFCNVIEMVFMLIRRHGVFDVLTMRARRLAK